MNKALMARAISKRSGPPKKDNTRPQNISNEAAPKVAKTNLASPELQKELLNCKNLNDSGKISEALKSYFSLVEKFENSRDFKDEKIAGNCYLLLAKCAMSNDELKLAVENLNKAGSFLQQNPQILRSLIEIYEKMNNLPNLQMSLVSYIEVVESKGNFTKSRPMRIRLAEVQEELGDKAEALKTLKAFITNGKAVSSPLEENSKDQDLNELMRLRCSALNRGQSGNAVNLPTEEETTQLKNSASSANKSNKAKPVNTTPVTSIRKSTSKVTLNSPASIKSGSTGTSFSNVMKGNDASVAGWILLASKQLSQNLDVLKKMGDKEKFERLSTLCLMLSGDESSEGRKKAAIAIAETIATSPLEIPWVEGKIAGFLNSKSQTAREGALLAIQAQAELSRLVSEPFLVVFLPKVFSGFSENNSSVRHCAVDAGKALVRAINPQALRLLIPFIIEGMENKEWRSKVRTLEIVVGLAAKAPLQMAQALPELVPVISKQVWDTHRQVQTSSKHALLAICTCIANPDIEPLVDKLVSVIGHPDEAMSTLDALMGTTFVSRVDGATLSVIAPLLAKCLRERNAGMRRKAACVISNMCKLVMNPKDVAPFIPLLLPSLQKAVNETADPEVTAVMTESLNTLIRAVGNDFLLQQAKNGISGPSTKDVGKMKSRMMEDLKKVIAKSDESLTIDDAVVGYIVGMCTTIVLYSLEDKEMLERDAWHRSVVPYLSPYASQDVCEGIFEEFYANEISKIQGDDEETDENDICNIEFSLAYGGKILLHNTKLRLKAGHRYGLIGANGAGKTTLMRNIANKNIDSLPEHLRTVFVEHDILGEEGNMPVIEFVFSALEDNVETVKVVETLSGVGFTESMISSPVSSLSGGWKMKLSLARAMLMNANILLLDEPTNHLDVKAVAWLTKYLAGLHDVTVLVVSHDTNFLDNVVTDILHYENQKLVPYHGNLTHFVRLRPEAKSYYALEAASLRFKFPNPGALDGITSTTKSILTLHKANYTYPGAEKPTLYDVSLKLCLASRVAVVGPNGAGKTTLIRLVVREDEPQSGDVWAHHNLRIAYVAQHSFHHVEQHLTKSPVQYLQWRFGSSDGTDREATENNMSMKLTKSEEEEMKKVGAIENIYGRRKTGRTLEYECSFVGMGKEFDRYITLEKLIEMGYKKMVQQADARVAAQAAGLDNRPTTTKEIQQHLDDFALAPEFSVHGKIGGLSGGQKVKLVLAAAMWNRPHLLVLDEPTNYLDREALGALTKGIQEFGGGVIMISHNQEFLDAICTETWILDGGRLSTKGGAEETALKTFSKKKDAEEEVEEAPSAGCTNKTVSYENLVNPRSLKLLSKKEVRKLAKLAEKAEIPLPEYIAGITRASPEWRWLSS